MFFIQDNLKKVLAGSVILLPAKQKYKGIFKVF